MLHKSQNSEASAVPNTSQKHGWNKTSVRRYKWQWVPAQTTDSEADIPLTQADISCIIEAVSTNLWQQQDTPLHAKPLDLESDLPLSKHN